MTRIYDFSLDNGICRTFTSVSVLRRWLDNRKQEFGNLEAFSKWLKRYFDKGNEISAHDEHYDFEDCLELL